MGIFYEQVEVINRAPIDLTVTFDGQQKTLKPGKNIIPAKVVPYAQNQNPIMGSQDPNNPTIHGARYLISVVGEDLPENLEPLTEEEWQAHLGEPQRINSRQAFEEQYANDPKAKLVVRGKRGGVPAKSAYEAGAGYGSKESNTSFTHDK